MTTAAVGSIRGQIRIDVKQALAAYASVRRANAQTRASLASAAGTFAKVGVGALAAAAPIVLLFKKAISAAADFQKKIDYFGAVTNASKEEMNQVAQAAISMSKTTVYSASQMADAFVEFGKAGVGTKDILGGVAAAVVNLAQAADITLAQATPIVVGAMKAYNLQASDARHITDLLAGAANASIVDISDLGTSLKYVGAVAGTTGVTLDSTVTALSLLGKATIKGSTAGTSLRQILLSLTPTSAKAKKELKELGIITKNNNNLFLTAKGGIKPLGDVFQVLQDHTRNLTQAQRLMALRIIFNNRAIAAAALLTKEGAAGFKQMYGEMGQVTAADVAHKRMDNLAGDIQRLKNNFQTMLIQVGGPLQNFMRRIVQGLTSMVKWFGSLSPQTQKMIIYGLGLVAAFLILVGILSLMIATVLKVISVYKDLKQGLTLLKDGFKAVGLGIRAMGAAFAANPILIWVVVIAAVIIALVLLWKKCAAFRNFIKGVWEAIKSFTVKLWNDMIRLLHTLGHAFETAGHAIKVAWNATIGFLVKILEFLKEHWKAAIAILGLLLGPVAFILALIVDAVTTHWKAISHFTVAIWKSIVGFVQTAWSIISGAVTTALSFIKNIIMAQLNAVKWVIMTALHLIEAGWNVVWGVIGGTVTRIWRAIWGTISAGARLVYNVVRTLIKYFLGAAGWLLNGGKNIVMGLFHGIAVVASGVFDIFLKYIYNPIIAIFGNAIKWLWDAGSRIIEGIWKGIEAMAGWLWKKVKGFMSNLWDSVLGFFGIKSPSRKGMEAGAWIVKGLAKGILDNRAHAVKAVNALNDAVMGAGTASLNLGGMSSLAHVQKAMNGSKASAYVGIGGSVGVSGPGVNVENLNVVAQPGEPIHESVPRAIRKATYIVGPSR